MAHDGTHEAASAAGASGRDTTPPEQSDPDACCGAAEELLRRGEPLMAYDILVEGYRKWPDHTRLRQHIALALSRSGAHERAEQWLETFFEEAEVDGQILGIFARTAKALATEAETEDRRRGYWTLAFRYYRMGYQVARISGERETAYYTGINAATLALLLGRNEEARNLGQAVQELCEQLLAEPGDDGSYWLRATLGEAALVLGDLPSAENHYAAASKLGKGDYASLNATRQQARRILGYLGDDPGRFDGWFRIPSMVVATGHMIDTPDRPTPRFPPEQESEVARRIAERLEAMDAEFGYASAAAGSDILFLEAILARGGEIHVVLPCPVEEFREVSVAPFPGDWSRRFDRVLEQASTVWTVGGEGALANAAAFDHANQVTFGLARISARRIGAPLRALAVWDGQTGNGLGGAESAVRSYRRSGLEPEILSPVPDRLPSVSSPPPAPSPSEVGPDDMVSETVAMLFADAAGFSELPENHLPQFVTQYLGSAAELVRQGQRCPAVTRTWGDGLFLVFRDVEEAGLFALDLVDRMTRTDWEARGLPASLNIRVGLHAGPAMRLTDPLTREINYIGTHVSRAARLEPVTPPGRVYASQAFSALAAAANVDAFACEYVGQTPLAKRYGTYPTYSVRRIR